LALLATDRFVKTFLCSAIHSFRFPPKTGLLALPQTRIVSRKPIRQSSFSAKTGFGLAPNADRLAKKHSPVLTFRESRFLALLQMQIVL
jgi:hypothetical protein